MRGGKKAQATAWSHQGGPTSPTVISARIKEALEAVEWGEEYMVLRWTGIVAGVAQPLRSARLDDVDLSIVQAQLGDIGAVVWAVAASQGWEGAGTMELVTRKANTGAHVGQITECVYLPELPEQDDPEAGYRADPDDEDEAGLVQSVLDGVFWWRENGPMVVEQLAPEISRVRQAWSEHGPRVKKFLGWD